MIEIKDFNQNKENDEIMPIEKCESCGMQKRRLIEYKTKYGKEKRICENCLMTHILFDDICEFRDEKDADVFARLNAFYSYKANQKEQNLFKLLLRYLWNIEPINLTEVRKLWDRHYRDPIEPYIKRFQEIGIIGDIDPPLEDGTEIAQWGDKMSLLIHKFTDAKEREDIDSWYYNIANVIKSAESLVGLSTELDRPTFDRNRNTIMKSFIRKCCDTDGNILETCKKYNTLPTNGFVCKFVNEKGNKCNLQFDTLEDVFIHLNDHDVPKERKEEFIERKEEFIGAWLSSDEITKQSDKISYTNWQHAINALIKAQDFFIELGSNPDTGKSGFLIDARVAEAMEKALIKTKSLIKEKAKVLEKQI